MHDRINDTHRLVDGYLGVYALLDRLHVVTDTLSQSLSDTELRGEFWKLKRAK